MRTFFYIPIGAVLVVLENLWVTRLDTWGRGPQFTLLFVVFLGLSPPPVRHMVLAFGIGATWDALNSGLPGLWSITMVLIYLAVVGIGQLFYMRSILTLGLLTTGLTLLAPAILWALTAFLGLQRGAASVAVSGFPAQCALNLAGALVLYPILFKVYDATDSEQRDGGYRHDYW